jgi:hypothetical protein
MRSFARAAGQGILLGALAACTEPRVVAAPMSASAAPPVPARTERDAGAARAKRVAKEPPARGCCAGKNDCKGKSSCAVEGRHDCAGKNDCKGRGTTCFGLDLE